MSMKAIEKLFGSTNTKPKDCSIIILGLFLGIFVMRINTIRKILH